ncbi:hypothetical protein RD792_007513 [Penstemon davidsonii]|uniref:Uncharacterized protein n=1 Tax=Penstemon davidsonii TaxID=160366 RepID=A0ABR0D6M3_9LAMI|nr:hypothetical protein RD792_007513 [Penstemon davidsonii]
MGIEIDLQELFQCFAFHCSCILVLGHDPTSLCEDLPYLPHEKAFADAEEAIWQRHVLPETIWKLQKWFQIGKEKELSKSKEILYNFLSNCIAMKQKDQIVTYNEQDFDLLTSYMRAISEKGNIAPNHSEEVWRDTMLNLIFPGKDTKCNSYMVLLALIKIPSRREENSTRDSYE